MAEGRSDIQAALFQRRSKVPIIHLRDHEHDVRVFFAPVAEDADDRLADRRQPYARLDFPTSPDFKVGRLPSTAAAILANRIADAIRRGRRIAPDRGRKR